MVYAVSHSLTHRPAVQVYAVHAVSYLYALHAVCLLCLPFVSLLSPFMSLTCMQCKLSLSCMHCMLSLTCMHCMLSLTCMQCMLSLTCMWSPTHSLYVVNVVAHSLTDLLYSFLEIHAHFTCNDEVCQNPNAKP